MLRIIFTYPDDLPGEIEKIIHLMEEGVDFVHIRKPDYSLGQLIEFISNIPEEYHQKLMIHNHYPLVGEFDLAGINLNRKAMAELVPEEEVDKCFIQPLVQTRFGIEINRIKPKLVSYSAHSFEEIEGLSFNPDYVFLSPIFDSISKEGYESAFEDLEELKSRLKKKKFRTIALGGIDDAKMSICEELGFNGTAMLGNVWKDEIKLI